MNKIIFLVLAAASILNAQTVVNGEWSFTKINAVRYCDRFPSLQACHDDLPSDGGKMVLPAGVYTLNSQLEITKNNVWMDGAGVGVAVIRHGSYTSAQAVMVSGANFKLSNLTIDGNSVTHDWAEVYLQGARALVDGVEFKSGRGSIYLAVDAADVKITNSTFIGEGSASTGTAFGIWHNTSNVIGLLVDNNTFVDLRLNAIFGQGVNVTYSNNHFRGNHRQTSPTGGGQIDIVGADSRNVTVVGNTFGTGGGSVTSALEVDAPSVTIVGNKIRGQWIGIVLQAGTNHQIIGNEISNNADDGIRVLAGISGFQIIGNRIYDDQGTKTQDWGINVVSGASDNYVITGNDLRGNINAAGITDNGSGANKQIWGNLPASPTNRILGEVGIGGAPISGLPVHITGAGDVTVRLNSGTSGTTPRIDFHKANAAKWSMFNDFGTDRYYLVDGDGNDGVYIAQNSTSWTANSDERLKTILGEIPDALAKVLQLRGVQFRWKTEQDGSRVGLVAQDVQAVLPEAVDADGEYLGVRYTELIPLIVNAIKELASRLPVQQ